MKRIFALVLAAVLALSLATGALAAEVQPTSQNITIDGEAVYCPAYNIDGYNYVRLRTLASLLRETAGAFDVQYDEETNTVTILRGRAYTGPVEEAWTMVDYSDTAVPSTQSVVIDDVARSDLSVWNIGGSNWFRLAELSKALGFGLSYDAATRTAQITTVPVQWNASDYAEVLTALQNAGGSGVRFSSAASASVNTKEVAVEEAADAEMATPAPTAAKNDAADFSGTNVQVAGIDEGDIVKTDGQYLYVIHNDEDLIILKAAGAATEEAARLFIGTSSYDSSDSKEDYWYKGEYKAPREMFVSDGRLAVISEYSSYSDYRTADGWKYENKEYVCVDFYDISDPTAPKALSSLGQDGNILGTRLMDGKLYLISSYWVWSYDEDDVSTYVPALYKGGEMHILPVDKIFIHPDCSSTEYVVACAYDMDGAACTASQSALGCGDTLYMNDSGIYVMGSHWFDDITKTYTESIYTVEEHLNGSETEILRFDPADLRITGSGKVPGYLDSQFSADAYEGNLRLVTTRRDSGYKVFKDETYGFENYQWEDSKTCNGLYILDEGLSVIGKVEDIAPEERVYSVRFDGPIAYFCTFRTIDPLFAADLSDPTAPKILSALKISGFSEYLHPWSEGRLFGLGSEADEEHGWREGLKLVMFDTTDKTNVTVKHTLVLDDCSYSEALYDHKAVFIDPVRGFVGFAADDEYRVYSYSDAEGFRLLCRIEYENWSSFTRGVRIGENAYIISSGDIVVMELPDWERITTVFLADAQG